MNMKAELEAEIEAAQDTIKSEMAAREIDELTVDVFKVQWTKVISQKEAIMFINRISLNGKRVLILDTSEIPEGKALIVTADGELVIDANRVTLEPLRISSKINWTIY
jgi:hypothetical protein